jgi:hypothetical protein
MSTSDPVKGRGPPANPYEPPKASFEPVSAKHEAGRMVGRGVATRRPPPGAQFTLPCRCGLNVTVAASEAGSSVHCDCGAPINVPSLGRLREMLGKAPYESGPADMIRRMVQTGELPAGRTCAVSGKPTDDVLELEILVPRSFRIREDWAQRAVDIWFFGSLIGFWLKANRPVEIEEADAVRLEAPLRVSARYHAKVRRMSQRRLKRLLGAIPAYAVLFEENQLAQVTVA